MNAVVRCCIDVMGSEEGVAADLAGEKTISGARHRKGTGQEFTTSNTLDPYSFQMSLAASQVEPAEQRQKMNAEKKGRRYLLKRWKQ